MGSKQSKDDKKHLLNFNEYLKNAEVYQAYHLVFKFVEEQSRELVQGPLFCESAYNAGRFLANNLKTKVPTGINLVYVYYTIEKLGF